MGTTGRQQKTEVAKAYRGVVGVRQCEGVHERRLADQVEDFGPDEAKVQPRRLRVPEEADLLSGSGSAAQFHHEVLQLGTTEGGPHLHVLGMAQQVAQLGHMYGGFPRS